MEDQSNRMKVVWSIVDRAPQNGGPAKSYWSRVGVGFVNRDGSMNLHLDAIPINGKLQVREWEPFERRGDSNGTGTGGNGEPPPRPRPRPQPSPGAGDSLL